MLAPKMLINHLRTLTSLSTLVLVVSGCQPEYPYTLEAEVTGLSLTLSPDEPSKSFLLKVCLPEDTRADELSTETSVWSDDDEAELASIVALGLGPDTVPLGPPGSGDFASAEPWRSVSSGGCAEFPVEFVLDPEATGPVSIEWEVGMIIASSEESIEQEEVVVTLVELE